MTSIDIAALNETAVVAATSGATASTVVPRRWRSDECVRRERGAVCESERRQCGSKQWRRRCRYCARVRLPCCCCRGCRRCALFGALASNAHCPAIVSPRAALSGLTLRGAQFFVRVAVQRLSTPLLCRTASHAHTARRRPLQSVPTARGAMAHDWPCLSCSVQYKARRPTSVSHLDRLKSSHRAIAKTSRRGVDAPCRLRLCSGVDQR